MIWIILQAFALLVDYARVYVRAFDEWLRWEFDFDLANITDKLVDQFGQVVQVGKTFLEF